MQFHFWEYVHKSEPDIYIGFSPALNLQCVETPPHFYQTSTCLKYARTNFEIFPFYFIEKFAIFLLQQCLRHR
jgi:hypothetical protein